MQTSKCKVQTLLDTDGSTYVPDVQHAHVTCSRLRWTAYQGLTLLKVWPLLDAVAVQGRLSNSPWRRPLQDPDGGGHCSGYCAVGVGTRLSNTCWGWPLQNPEWRWLGNWLHVFTVDLGQSKNFWGCNCDLRFLHAWQSMHHSRHCPSMYTCTCEGIQQSNSSLHGISVTEA